MNRYPLWKYLLIAILVALGLVYAMPNLYPQDPSLQISGRRTAVDEAIIEQVVSTLETHGIEFKGHELVEDRLLVRFGDPEVQLKAASVLEPELGGDYITALNIAPSTPDWLAGLGGRPMYLGLDLRGGVHFLMEVDMAAVLKQTYERYVSELRTELRGEKLRYQTISVADRDSGVLVRFRDREIRDQAADFISGQYQDLTVTEQDQASEFNVLLTLSETAILEEQKSALHQNISTLRNRVNELGVAEPVIQQQGSSRIVVQLPGVQDTARAKEILGATATLEFRLVNREVDYEDLADGKVPVGADVFPTREGVLGAQRGVAALDKRVMLTGDRIIDAASGIDSQTQGPAVFITLDGRGARQFQRVTGDNVGQPMAVLFIENKTDITRGENGKIIRKSRVEKEVINIATIREQLSKRFQITGLDSTDEARDLALLLRAGALAAPIQIIEERTVGPSLGQQNIDRGLESVLIGFALVLIVMAAYYKVFGLIANVALTVNLVLLIALLSMLQATLTLPGIAGIVLTVGMAVDANVLIFERIREELRNGNSPHASINSGYEKAFSTIADANVTTLIAAVVLFGFGTGPVKGFAVTLSLGILTSMFTAIMGTRAVVNLLYGGRRLQRLSI